MYPKRLWPCSTVPCYNVFIIFVLFFYLVTFAHAAGVAIYVSHADDMGYIHFSLSGLFKIGVGYICGDSKLKAHRSSPTTHCSQLNYCRKCANRKKISTNDSTCRYSQTILYANNNYCSARALQDRNLWKILISYNHYHS